MIIYMLVQYDWWLDPGQSRPRSGCYPQVEFGGVTNNFHEGDCGNHTGGRALFSRILRTGYYWPTMKRDAVEYARKCDPCQRHSNILHQPAEFLHPIPSVRAGFLQYMILTCDPNQWSLFLWQTVILSRTSGSGSWDIMVILILTATSTQYNIVLQEHLAGYALDIMIQERVFTNMARA